MCLAALVANMRSDMIVLAFIRVHLLNNTIPFTYSGLKTKVKYEFICSCFFQKTKDIRNVCYVDCFSVINSSYQIPALNAFHNRHVFEANRRKWTFYQTIKLHLFPIIGMLPLIIFPDLFVKPPLALSILSF